MLSLSCCETLKALLCCPSSLARQQPMLIISKLTSRIEARVTWRTASNRQWVILQDETLKMVSWLSWSNIYHVPCMRSGLHRRVMDGLLDASTSCLRQLLVNIFVLMISTRDYIDKPISWYWSPATAGYDIVEKALPTILCERASASSSVQRRVT